MPRASICLFLLCRQITPFKERLEDTQSMEGQFFLLQMLLHFIHLILHIHLCLVLIFRHVLDLRLKSHILRFNDPRVFSLLQADLIRKGPSQYLDAALIKNDIEFVLLHFQGILMIEDWIEGVDQRNRRQICGLDFVLEGRLFGESGVNGGLDHLEEDKALAPVPAALVLLAKLFELVLIPQNTHLRSLQILNVLPNKVIQRRLGSVITSLHVQLMKDIAITSLMNLLIQNIQKLIVIVLLMGHDVGILGQDFGFQLMVVELFGAEDGFVLTIHFEINIIEGGIYNIGQMGQRGRMEDGARGGYGGFGAVKGYVYVLGLMCLWAEGLAISTDNTCTFKADGNLFTLAVLNRYSNGTYYREHIDDHTTIVFNFCDPMIPQECTDTIHEKAYSFVVRSNNVGAYSCEAYSSDSKTSYFTPQYVNVKGEIKLNLSMDKPSNSSIMRSTDFFLECQESDDISLKHVKVQLQANKIVIYGTTPYACPVFQLSSIWKALTENLLIFGIVLFIVGFVMLFFGVLMTHLMIFITAYFLSFAVLTGIFTAILRPDSSTLAIYYSLLLIMFLSTLIAYGLTRLVKVSIFFIGAFFGFIVATIVNSIFCNVFSIYSVWSLVVFQVLFTIPFGLLTFKYSEEVIVMSTSLAGSYMIIRPISWIFGGFPNEFALEEMIENGEAKFIPWAFFLYLAFIIVLAIIGALYQLLKIKRRTPHQQINKNFITENVETHIDRIKEAVENLIGRYAPDNEDQYKKMNEMQEMQQTPKDSIQDPSKTKERKSREEHF